MWTILGALFGVVCILLLAVAVYDSNRFVTVNYRIEDPRIRKRVRLALLADLHNKQYGKDNDRLLQAIRAQKPDLILCAGDMITSVPGKTMEPAKDLIRKLAGEYPFYFADGNHEHRICSDPETFAPMGEQFCESLEKSGVCRLVNENVSLPSLGLRIYGLDLDRDKYRKFGRPRLSREELRRLLGDAPEADFVILLAHNPAFFKAYAAWGSDLTLSGHLHGGVMRLPWVGGVLSTSFRVFPKYDGGMFEEAGRRMVVSRGLGGHTIPVRIFNPAELVIIDLIPKDRE